MHPADFHHWLKHLAEIPLPRTSADALILAEADREIVQRAAGLDGRDTAERLGKAYHLWITDHWFELRIEQLAHELRLGRWRRACDDQARHTARWQEWAQGRKTEL
jgi:hypothetical protein